MAAEHATDTLPTDAIVTYDNLTIPEYIRPYGLRYVDAFQRFYDHPYGQFLATQELRFSAHYGYDASLMRDDLRLDVDPLAHNALTYIHVASTINMQRTVQFVDDYEAAVALFTAGIHDMGESKHPELEAKVGAVVGDIPFGHKSDQDREIEAAIRQVQYAEHLSDFPPHFIDRVEGTASHRDHDSLAHTYYETGHAVVALATCLKAGKIILQERGGPELPAEQRLPEERILQLSALARIATANVVNFLEPFAEMNIRSAQLSLRMTESIRRRIAEEIDLPRTHVALG